MFVVCQRSMAHKHTYNECTFIKPWCLCKIYNAKRERIHREWVVFEICDRPFISMSNHCSTYCFSNRYCSTLLTFWYPEACFFYAIMHGFAVDWQYRLLFYAYMTLSLYMWVTSSFWPFVISVTLSGHCSTKMWWMAGLWRILQPSYLCDTVLIAVVGVLTSIRGARLGGTSMRTICN